MTAKPAPRKAAPRRAPHTTIIDQVQTAARTAATRALDDTLPVLREKMTDSFTTTMGELFGTSLAPQPVEEPADPGPAVPVSPDPVPAPPTTPVAPADSAPPVISAPPSAPPPLPWENAPAIGGSPVPSPPPDSPQLPTPSAPDADTTAPVIEVTTTPGVLPAANLRSLDAWRALLHQLTPVVVTTLLSLTAFTSEHVGVYVALFFAVIDPVLSYTNTADKARRIVYGLLGVLQTAGVLATLLVGHEAWIPLAAAGVTILSSFLARFFTPTPTLVPLDSPRALRAPSG